MSKKKKQIMLFLYYSKHFSLKPIKTKQIVVCFDGLFPHGGLVDRLKGIVSFYLIAKALGYDFKILFDTPFELDVFLQPNAIDWKFKRSNVKWHPTKTRCLYFINNFNANPLAVIKKSNASQFYVYANIDYSKSIFPELNQDDLEKKWREGFNQLFKKSDFLEEKLNTISTEPFIAFHSRFTSLMGDFKDTTSKKLSAEEKNRLCDVLLQIINRVKAEEQQKAYLFSDSINFIKHIKQQVEINTIEGNPFHMDNFEMRSGIEGHLKTMIDFFMISKSKKVYFLKVKPMYNSSFSKYAAIIGNVNFECLEV
ncbi:hypothetical protein EYD45_08815 [Hyunsoonleella flava]|uniref:Uncharacterized protein n=1 Tax=Hyunsoonleella flava TaxID=2527939 RepID=A0A4Q9FDG1_9FLAO|nr:hypothetical protein [Hyunsoonleella flava]TBN03609.1 hypothetical protein EYD45_08815 [Hyunsoonleella flava]